MMKKISTASVVLLLNMGAAYAQGTINGNTMTAPNTPNGATAPATNSAPGNVMAPSSTTSGSTGIDYGNTNTAPAPAATPVSTDVSTTPSQGGMNNTNDMGTTTNPMTTTPAMTSTTGTTTLPTAFMCTGMNSSWTASIANNSIAFSSAKIKDLNIKSITPITPIGDSTGNLKAYTASKNGKHVTILINHNAAGCRMGMPGQSYQYDAFIVFQGNVIVGCCNPA